MYLGFHSAHFFNLSKSCIPILLPDADECQLLVDNWCPQTCMNRKATFNMTYQCVCGPGFTDLNMDGRSCIPSDGKYI